jgi:hypothetical protein
MNMFVRGSSFSHHTQVNNTKLNSTVETVKSIKIELFSRQPISTLALEPSLENEASISLKKAGYKIDDGKLIRRVNKTTGEGFWDKTIGEQRMVSYGPGEYVQPHYHDIYEKFDIKSGGCHVWISQNNGDSWSCHYCGLGQLYIPKQAWHCLVAGNEGLCMDVCNDDKRSINWLDEKHSVTWSTELNYIITIQELIDATNRLLQE